MARGDGVWIFVGYPTYGQGPFEQLGTPTSVPLLVGFLLVAMVEAVVGLLLWTGRRAGSVLADAGVSAEPGRNTDGSRTPPVRLGVRWRPGCRPCRSVP